MHDIRKLYDKSKLYACLYKTAAACCSYKAAVKMYGTDSSQAKAALEMRESVESSLVQAGRCYKSKKSFRRYIIE